jgi:hypothetical protein
MQLVPPGHRCRRTGSSGQRTLGTSIGWVGHVAALPSGMVRTDRKPLSGDVEVDVGRVERDAKRGRGTNKCVVVIAVEIKRPKGFGRIRMRHVSDASGNCLVPFVREVIEPGSMILTDGWGDYNGSALAWIPARSSTGVPGGVQFSVQPPHLPKSGPSVPLADRASSGHQPHHRRRDHQWYSW